MTDFIPSKTTFQTDYLYTQQKYLGGSHLQLDYWELETEDDQGSWTSLAT
jgi:hypothetical protein